jgi:hypothetical protein
MSNEQLIASVKAAYGTYMYYECAERHYDADRALSSKQRYFTLLSELERRNIEMEW